MQSFFIQKTKSLIRLRSSAGWSESSFGTLVKRYVFFRVGSYIPRMVAWKRGLVFHSQEREEKLNRTFSANWNVHHYFPVSTTVACIRLLITFFVFFKRQHSSDTVDFIDEQRRPWSVCAHAQTDQGLLCSHMAEGPLLCVQHHMSLHPMRWADLRTVLSMRKVSSGPLFSVYTFCSACVHVSNDSVNGQWRLNYQMKWTLAPMSSCNGLFHFWIWTVPLLIIGVSVLTEK